MENYLSFDGSDRTLIHLNYHTRKTCLSLFSKQWKWGFNFYFLLCIFVLLSFFFLLNKPITFRVIHWLLLCTCLTRFYENLTHFIFLKRLATPSRTISIGYPLAWQFKRHNVGITCSERCQNHLN